MSEKIYNLLVVCTGNSCRSVMTEALLNYSGKGKIKAYSAGSHPIGRINEGALATLKRHDLPTKGYQSQSWEDFTDIQVDIVITVCDNAQGETCPVYLTQAVRAHWGVSDPSHIEGSEEEKMTAFEETFRILSLRVNALLKLPLENLSKDELTIELSKIGKLD